MCVTDEIQNDLHALKSALVNEKKVLMENDGDALLSLLHVKETLLARLNDYPTDVDMQPLEGLLRDIKQLQETNLLLTEQSMKHTETILSQIKKAAEPNNTYSKKGTFDRTETSALFDQSL